MDIHHVFLVVAFVENLCTSNRHACRDTMTTLAPRRPEHLRLDQAATRDRNSSSCLPWKRKWLEITVSGVLWGRRVLEEYRSLESALQPQSA